MSNRTKMYSSNSKARKYLLKLGAVDIHLFPHNRFIKDFNLEGLGFDGIASLSSKLALFQIKTNCKPTKALQTLLKEVGTKFGIYCLWLDVRRKKGIIIYGL